VEVAIVVYKGLIPVVYRMLTFVVPAIPILQILICS